MIAFSFFGLNIYWYGIFYFISFLFGYLFFLSIKKYSFIEKYAPNFYILLKKSPEDIVLYAVLWILIWGRLGHIFIYDFSYYFQNPINVFYLWEWGMSFIGGVLWVVVLLFFLLRKYRFSWKDFFVLTDLLIVPTWFWIMLWRIGNFLNQELYGRLVSDVFPNLSLWIIDFFSNIRVFTVYYSIDDFLRINTNFLSSFFEWFIVFAFSLVFVNCFIKNKKRKIWFISSFFILWYSLVRFIFEYLRMDSQMEFVWLLTKSQRFFSSFFLIGIVVMMFFYRKNYIK